MEQEKVINFLDIIYDKALNGSPISKSVEDLADEYLSKYSQIDEAVKSLVDYQLLKCGTSGFLTGLGGLITLPVAVPANITSVVYVQLRMIACIAYMYGHNISDDTVKTLAYACLTGSAMADILKQSGIKFTTKVTTNLIKKIPGSALTKINQRVGMRFITKFGEKGIINLGKLVPGVGGVIGATIDIASTKLISKNAIKVFHINKSELYYGEIMTDSYDS